MATFLQFEKGKTLYAWKKNGKDSIVAFLSGDPFKRGTSRKGKKAIKGGHEGEERGRVFWTLLSRFWKRNFNGWSRSQGRRVKVFYSVGKNCKYRTQRQSVSLYYKKPGTYRLSRLEGGWGKGV